MSDLETYLQKFEAARAQMREMVNLAQENPLIYQPWRMKEVLDHLTGWDDAIIASIQSMLAGEIPATPAIRGVDVYNAETVSSREALPYAVSQRECEASRAELLRLMRNMNDEQLHRPFTMPWGGEGTIESLVDTFSRHEETHAKEIREIIFAGK
jgi:hypothetical protein